MLRSILIESSHSGADPAPADTVHSRPERLLCGYSPVPASSRARPVPGFTRPAKRFRVCPRCPFYCRIEEPHRDCAYCRVPLRAQCDAGHAIGDPCDAGCPDCGLPLREAMPEATAAVDATPGSSVLQFIPRNP